MSFPFESVFLLILLFFPIGREVSQRQFPAFRPPPIDSASAGLHSLSSNSAPLTLGFTLYDQAEPIP